MPELAGEHGDAARKFALSVVRKLQQAEFTAYFAGGCVRDQLMGREPKDYDVATDARPEQIRELFGKRRTLPIGAAFGVITVLGPRHAGQIEVATFRQDASYSDGRHPDQVSFSSPEQDAIRRDFTINGLFLDPVAGRVIDFVGGERDIRLGVVRAIGEASARIGEDKLRMLRAIRFTTALEFALEEATSDAIKALAGEIHVVSAERIAGEFERMLVDPHRARAVDFLRETGLLAELLPELFAPGRFVDWELLSRTLEALSEPSFALALNTLLAGSVTAEQAESICRRWKLSNEQRKEVVWLLSREGVLWEAESLPWPRLQRILIDPRIQRLLQWHDAQAGARQLPTNALEFCRERLAWPARKLNPAPVITGDDLSDLGIPRGRVYRDLLEAVRDKQLDGEIENKSAALKFARELYDELTRPS